MFESKECHEPLGMPQALQLRYYAVLSSGVLRKPQRTMTCSGRLGHVDGPRLQLSLAPVKLQRAMGASRSWTKFGAAGPGLIALSWGWE